MKCLLQIWTYVSVFTQFCECGYVVNYDYYGRECTRKCNNQNNGHDGTWNSNSGKISYNFCFVNEEGDWGYCSPDGHTTSYFNTCREDSQCEKHGEKYYWCKTVDGSWDYCSPSPFLRTGTRHYDSDGFVCKGIIFRVATISTN